MSPRYLSALVGLAYAYLTSLPVVVGAIAGTSLVDASRYGKAWGVLADVAGSGVGHRYAEIASHGYRLDDYAFFPLLPLLGRGIGMATGLGSKEALLIVAYIALGAAFVALRAYAKKRFPEEAEHERDYILLAFGLWPATFFFRMAYPEPLFLFLAIVTLLCIERKWQWTSAVIAGLASAATSVGVALALPVAMAAWRVGGPVPIRTARALLSAVLACWGLIGYMGYQYRKCGNALEFVHAQSYCCMRPNVSMPRRAIALATGEPIRGLYDPSSSTYWSHKEGHRAALFSYSAASAPLLMIVTGGILIGWRRGLLTATELTLCAGLLVIPYITHVHEMGISGMGRCASIAFPFYLVVGKALSSISRALAAVLLALAATFLMVYSSLVAAGFNLI